MFVQVEFGFLCLVESGLVLTGACAVCSVGQVGARARGRSCNVVLSYWGHWRCGIIRTRLSSKDAQLSWRRRIRGGQLLCKYLLVDCI